VGAGRPLALLLLLLVEADLVRVVLQTWSSWSSLSVEAVVVVVVIVIGP
jgi:membrane protein YdbS with pleckstrin-like domain